MKFLQHIKNKRGFSLVETIIYVAFFAGLISAMIFGLAVSFKAYSFTRAKRQISIDANLAIERIVREVRQASSINDGSSSFGVNPGVLVLNSIDTSGNPVTVKFSVVNDVISVTENSVLVGGITSGFTDVENLTFTKLTTPVGAGVKIDLRVRSTKGVSNTADFHNTAMLRGAY